MATSKMSRMTLRTVLGAQAENLHMGMLASTIMTLVKEMFAFYDLRRYYFDRVKRRTTLKDDKKDIFSVFSF